MDYERDIKIDENALDLEWKDQAELFMKYALHLANTQKELDSFKQELDIMRAEIDKSIRENPEKYGIEKVTEGAIQSAILTDKGFIQANKDYLNVKFENDMAKNAVQAFNQRKEALENLVKLHGQQYFAGPKMPRDLSFEAEKREKQKKANVAVGSMMRRTR